MGIHTPGCGMMESCKVKETSTHHVEDIAIPEISRVVSGMVTECLDLPMERYEAFVHSPL